MFSRIKFVIRIIFVELPSITDFLEKKMWIILLLHRIKIGNYIPII